MPIGLPSLSKFTKQEISKLFSSARRCLKQPSLDILLSPTLTGSLGRILVITSRRIGNAPTRNKVRRRFKAIYHEDQFLERGYDCIVIVKPEGVRRTFDELKMLLNKAFESPYLPKKPHDQ